MVAYTQRSKAALKYGLSEAKIRQYRKAFDHFDTNGSGFLEAAELEASGAPKSGRKPTLRQRLRAALRQALRRDPDLAGDGSSEAWREACAAVAGCTLVDADALFRLVDDDRDGELGRRELALFVRDDREKWSRRAGLDADALDDTSEASDPHAEVAYAGLVW